MQHSEENLSLKSDLKFQATTHINPKLLTLLNAHVNRTLYTVYSRFVEIQLRFYIDNHLFIYAHCIQSNINLENLFNVLTQLFHSMKPCEKNPVYSKFQRRMCRFFFLLHFISSKLQTIHIRTFNSLETIYIR